MFIGRTASRPVANFNATGAAHGCTPVQLRKLEVEYRTRMRVTHVCVHTRVCVARTCVQCTGDTDFAIELDPDSCSSRSSDAVQRALTSAARLYLTVNGTASSTERWLDIEEHGDPCPACSRSSGTGTVSRGRECSSALSHAYDGRSRFRHFPRASATRIGQMKVIVIALVNGALSFPKI